MIKNGIITENDRIELLEGMLIAKARQTPRHSAVISGLNRHLVNLPEDLWIIRIRSGFTTSDSEPEPDVAVVKALPDEYLTRHPSAGDAAAIMEVSDIELASDRSLKLRIYAHAKVREYWIINLQDNVIEVYSDPIDRGADAYYRRKTIYSIDDRVSLLLAGCPTMEFSVKSVLLLKS